MFFAFRGKRERGVNVRRGEFGKVIDDICFAHADGEPAKNIADRDAHSANAGASAALLRVKSDAIRVIHRDNIEALCSRLKRWFL